MSRYDVARPRHAKTDAHKDFFTKGQSRPAENRVIEHYQAPSARPRVIPSAKQAQPTRRACLDRECFAAPVRGMEEYRAPKPTRLHGENMVGGGKLKTGVGREVYFSVPQRSQEKEGAWPAIC